MSLAKQTFPDAPLINMDDVMHTYKSQESHGIGSPTILHLFFVGEVLVGGGRDNHLNQNTTTKIQNNNNKTRRTMNKLLVLGREG